MGKVDPRVKEQQRQWHKEVGSVDTNLILIMIITTDVKKGEAEARKVPTVHAVQYCSTNSTYNIPRITQYSCTSNLR